MELSLIYFAYAKAKAEFTTGDTVTIQVFDKDGTDVTPDSPDNACSEIGTTGIFKWDFSNLTTPTVYQDYTWVMTNQLSATQWGRNAFYPEDPRCFFMIPFDVDISAESINKGDSFEPEIRIDTNASDLNVIAWFSDGETDDSTNIYKATSDVTDRGDGIAGGTDQIELVATGDTFKIFRIYLSGTETETFDSRFVDLTITAAISDTKTQTVKKKIAFTETPAISYSLTT